MTSAFPSGILASGVIALVLLIITSAIIKKRRKIAYSFRQQLPKFALSVTRLIRSYPMLFVSILTIIVIAWAVILQKFQTIVIVTLFYGTVLFFTNVLQQDRPFPILAFDTKYYDSTHGASSDRGFQYEFVIQNNGNEALIDPTVEFCLYNSDFTKASPGWVEMSETARQSQYLDPGDRLELTIEYEPVSDDDSVDYYLAVRVIPRPQYRDVTLWWTTTIGDSS